MITRQTTRFTQQDLFQDRVIVPTDPRQVGKTTLLRTLADLAQRPVTWLNGDEPDGRASLENASSTHLRALVGGGELLFMKHTLLRPCFVLFVVSICLSACVTSKTKPIAQVNGDLQADTSSIRVFLLEREIPQDIEQLGVVTLSVAIRPTLDVDAQVKKQLRKECQQLGAK